MVPVTVSKYVPGVALGATVNPLPDNWPDPVIVHVAEATITGLDGDWPKVHVPRSPELNPPPVTAIWTPIAAAFGVGTMNGALVVTVKVLEAESPLVPVTVIVYVPGVAVAATLNPLGAIFPLVSMVHVDAATITGAAGAWEITHTPASARLNPPPLMVTAVLTGPKVGVSTIAGVGIVKDACAVSPVVVPFRVTV